MAQIPHEGVPDPQFLQRNFHQKLSFFSEHLTFPHEKVKNGEEMVEF